MRLATASYNQPGRNAGRLVNCYAEQSVGKTPVNIVPFPGISSVGALAGGGRGLTVARNTLMAVAGEGLYDAISGSQLGTLPGTDYLTFATNPTQTVFSNGYYYDGTVRSITDEDKVPWEAIDYCDGYILAVEADSGRFVGSSLNDGSAWDGLDFATAEGSPDDLVTLIVDHRQVILFGKQSVELWWNSGATGFPFERMASGYLEIGCAAKWGVTKADNSVFWLASDGTIRRLAGTTPVRVSQVGVEQALRGYTLSDCIAFHFVWGGQIHVWFRFPTDDASWVFNVTTGEWWESDLPLVSAATFNGRVYVQHEDGMVGYLTESTRLQFGEIPRFAVTFPNTYQANGRLFFNQLDAVFSTGYVDSGVIPKATLEVSHDGGSIYHTLPVKELGRTGKFGNVVRWTKLGTGRDTVFRLTWDYPCALVDAQLAADAGAK